MTDFNNTQPGIKDKGDSYICKYGHTYEWLDEISNYHITKFNRKVLTQDKDTLLENSLKEYGYRCAVREMYMFEEKWYLLIDDKDENAVDL